MEQCGFIGLGIMGRPMAANLLQAGCGVLVHDIDPASVEQLRVLGGIPSTVEQLADSCEVVFLILPDGQIVQQVLFGENGLAWRLRPGSIVVDMSSVTPAESIFCAEKLQGKQIRFIDAPVSGGEPKAIDGTLAIMAGGDERDFQRVLPFLEIMGGSAVLVGAHGSGSVAKLTNQAIVNLTIAAVSEAFVLAEKAGADVAAVYQAIRGGLAGSAVLDAKLPLIMERNFQPGGKISINLKDIKNVMKTAHDIDAPMPFSGQLLEVMQSLKVAGGMDEDHGSIVKYFERLAGVEVKKKGQASV